MTLHDDELAVDVDLVRRLLARDLPALADRPLRPLAASGSTNRLFRLGGDHLVRLPRQPGGSAALAAETRWGAHLAPFLPVAVPRVVAAGGPGFGYPEQWTVTGWIDGRPPATPEPDGPAADALARDLAAVVGAWSAAPVPAAALADPALRGYRGGPPAAVDADVRAHLDRCRARPRPDLDLDACAAVWATAVAAPGPPPGAPARWAHGDLLAENLLVRGGRLAAVLDLGALAVGDPGVDLVVAWEVLGPRARAVFRAALDVDDATWDRARGWAVAIAVMTLSYYAATMPARCAARLAMARQVLADGPVTR